MTIEEIYQFIPESFILTNHKIKVTVVDRIDENNYGDWNDISNEIRLSRTLKCDDKIIELSKIQIENTFYHELAHALMFFTGIKQDEMIAQGFANLIYDYVHTRKYQN